MAAYCARDSRRGRVTFECFNAKALCGANSRAVSGWEHVLGPCEHSKPGATRAVTFFPFWPCECEQPLGVMLETSPEQCGSIRTEEVASLF